MKNVFIIITLIIFQASNVCSQNFEVDSLFSENGILQINTFGRHLNTKLSKIDNNSIFLSGSEYNTWWFSGALGEDSYVSQYKINSCGRIDSSYGTNGKVDGENYNIFPENYSIDNIQRTLVAGSKIEGGWQFPYLSLINNNGNRDTSFQIQQIHAYISFPSDIYRSKFLNFEIDSISQKIFCIGTYSRENEKGVLLMNFNFDGSIDSTIYPEVKREIPLNNLNSQTAAIDYGKSIKIDQDRYLMTGITEDSDSLILVMINKDGTLDDTFGDAGVKYEANLNVSREFSFINIFTELISNNLFISSKEFENDQAVFNIRKYNIQGNIDMSFGVDGKIQIVPDSGFFYNYQMSKILNDKLLLSFYGYNSYNDSLFNEIGDYSIINEDGSINNDYVLNFENQNINPNKCLFTDLILDTENKIYIVGTTYDSKLTLLRFTSNSLVPNLSIEGDSIISNISNYSNASFQWIINGTVESINNSPNLFISETGQYILNVTDITSCGLYSDTISILTLNDIKMKDNSDFINVFPNPSTNEITVKSNGKINDCLILDNLNRVVYQNKIDSNETKIDISFLKPGLYYIKINSNCKMIVKN